MLFAVIGSSAGKSRSEIIGGRLESRERRLVLPGRLADRGANGDLEDLVFAQPRRTSCGDVLVGDLVGPIRQFADQGRQRLVEYRVVERGAPLRVRRLAISFEDPCDDCFASLPDVRHLVPA